MSSSNSQRITPIAMSVEEIAALSAVAARLDKLMRASTRLVGDVVNAPKPGSRIDRAYRTDVRDAYDLASVLLLSAEDHSRTIWHTLTNKDAALPTFALYTLLRAAAEAFVRCCHLLDPAISESERLARALDERRDNIAEARKADAPSARSFYDARITHLEQRATTNTIAVLRSRNGAIIGFGSPHKSETDLFGDYLPAGAAAFRYLSGHVHSKAWAQLPRDQSEPSGEPGVQNARPVLKVLLFSAIFDGVLDLYDKSVGCWFVLAGYPAEVWHQAKQG